MLANKNSIADSLPMPRNNNQNDEFFFIMALLSASILTTSLIYVDFQNWGIPCFLMGVTMILFTFFRLPRGS